MILYLPITIKEYTAKILERLWNIADSNAIMVWESASAVYASQASGEVWALIGTTMRPNSVWQTIELQNLMDNPNVTKITTIDPETLVKKVMFRR